MYATKADLVKRFGDEIEQLESMHANPSASVQEALQDATEEINSYIGGRYPLPLPNVPSRLEQIACDIARYYLYHQQVTEMVEKRYDNAIEFLKLVASSKAHLQIQDAITNEIVEERPDTRPVTAPIGTTYTGGVFGDDVLGKMPTM